MAYYKDLREYILALEAAGLLIRVRRPINKDTELHPLVRLQYRGLPEEARKAFLFENVFDSTGKHYDIPVALCVLAGSSKIYSIGLMCRPEMITEKLAEAVSRPIPPMMVDRGPVQEEVFIGDGLMEKGGLNEFPIPISTPGYDAAPFITAPFWVTKDPETGIRNIGTYRAQLKSGRHTGVMFMIDNQGAAIHWKKCKAKGIPLEAALVIGASPNIGYVAVSKFPVDMDEYGVAGAIAGEPVTLVKCKTIDVEVPANAEIVIEGEISTKEVEPEAPFGESLGFIGMEMVMPLFNVKCITHRRNPIWLAFMSQYPPSESSKIRQHSNEGILYKYLRDDLKMPFVLDIGCFDPVGANRYWAIKMAKTEPENVWRALEAAGKRFPRCKIMVAVDEDINAHDPEAVNWALCHRMQPHRDMRTIKVRAVESMECSLVPMDERDKLRDISNSDMPDSSHVLIDTTMKWPYPPIALPKKEFMERAIHIWQEEGLPPLNLKEPVWGHNLGYWTQEDEQKALWAIKGEYHKTSEYQARQRKPA